MAAFAYLFIRNPTVGKKIGGISHFKFGDLTVVCRLVMDTRSSVSPPVRALFSVTGLGWLSTISALSFGALFWFDVLVKPVIGPNTTRKLIASVSSVSDSR